MKVSDVAAQGNEGRPCSATAQGDTRTHTRTQCVGKIKFKIFLQLSIQNKELRLSAGATGRWPKWTIEIEIVKLYSSFKLREGAHVVLKVRLR